MKSERLGEVVVTTVEVAAVNKVVVLEAEVIGAVPKMPTAENAN